jgi:phosphinothricin acetyltransferase
METHVMKRSDTISAPLRVRRPFLKDFPAILEISNWATCHTAANFKTEPDSLERWEDLWRGKAETFPWLVAETDDTVIGFAMTSPFHGRCGCTFAVEVSVYVHPDHLGKRVGSALYGHLIPTLETQGFRTVIAVIAIPNPASERLHEAYGFRRVGLIARAGWKFGRWHDLAYWQLMLGDRDDHEEPHCVRNLHEIRAASTNGRDA